MAPGARSKFGTPMFEFEVCREQMYCIEESTLLGLFDGLAVTCSDSTPVIMIRHPGNCAPFVTPLPLSTH